MALEDSEQKYNLLHSVFTDLEDLSLIFETDDLIQSIQEFSGQVAALQQQIVETLPHIQQVADVSDCRVVGPAVLGTLPGITPKSYGSTLGRYIFNGCYF